MTEPVVGSGRSITVRGTGRVAKQPDLAEVRLGVLMRRPTVGSARTDAAEAMRGMLDAVAAVGVDRADVRTSLLSIQPAWEHDEATGRSRMVGHEVFNSVTVAVRDLAALGSAIDAALAAGATSLDGLELRIAEPGDVEAEALALAVADAQRRASVLATASGLRLIGVRSVTEGAAWGPVAPVARFQLSEAAAETPIEGGRTGISVAIEVVFDVEPVAG